MPTNHTRLPAATREIIMRAAAANNYAGFQNQMQTFSFALDSALERPAQLENWLDHQVPRWAAEANVNEIRLEIREFCRNSYLERLYDAISEYEGQPFAMGLDPAILEPVKEIQAVLEDQPEPPDLEYRTALTPKGVARIVGDFAQRYLEPGSEWELPIIWRRSVDPFLARYESSCEFSLALRAVGETDPRRALEICRQVESRS